MGHHQLGVRAVEDDDIGAVARKHPRKLTLTTAKIENSASTAQTLANNGLDLLFVFGITPFGEARLPPSCIRLP
jgi:hypothetical protein